MKTSIHLSAILAAIALLQIGNLHATVIWNISSYEQFSTPSLGGNATSNPAIIGGVGQMDLGNNNNGYFPVPFFTFQMNGYANGGSIGSVDLFRFVYGTGMVGATIPAQFNADLYAFKTSLTDGVTAPEYYNSPGTLIASNVLTPSTSVGNIDLGATGRANVLSYLQSNYTTNSFVTFTLRSNNINNGGLYRLEAFNAVVNTSAVPEPGTLTMAAIGGLGLLLSRRIRRKLGGVRDIA